MGERSRAALLDGCLTYAMVLVILLSMAAHVAINTVSMERLARASSKLYRKIKEVENEKKITFITGALHGHLFRRHLHNGKDWMGG